MRKVLHSLHYNVLGCKDMQIINKTKQNAMKQFILYLFILLPFCVNSQVNETFDGPMLGADWIGKDRGQFVVNADGRLQLNIEPTESGTASIGKEIAYSPDMQWEFDVYMQNQPSDENKLCIYLYQENQERYYYVRIGNTGNKELGLKRNGNGNLILPQTDFEESPLLLHVKVTPLRSNLGEFVLQDRRYGGIPP